MFVDRDSSCWSLSTWFLSWSRTVIPDCLASCLARTLSSFFAFSHTSICKRTRRRKWIKGTLRVKIPTVRGRKGASGSLFVDVVAMRSEPCCNLETMNTLMPVRPTGGSEWFISRVIRPRSGGSLRLKLASRPTALRPSRNSAEFSLAGNIFSVFLFSYAFATNGEAPVNVAQSVRTRDIPGLSYRSVAQSVRTRNIPGLSYRVVSQSFRTRNIPGLSYRVVSKSFRTRNIPGLSYRVVSQSVRTRDVLDHPTDS
jgi:ribosomal protein S12